MSMSDGKSSLELRTKQQGSFESVKGVSYPGEVTVRKHKGLPSFKKSGEKKAFSLDGEDTNNGTAVIVIKDGLILCGERTDGKGICGPGGHVQDDETSEQGAIRECQEEFGITPEHLICLGLNESSTRRYRPSETYVTDEYSGEVSCDDGEMKNPRWLSIEKLRLEKLFPAFEGSLDLLQQNIRKYVHTEGIHSIIKEKPNDDGGPGSGNHGHAGVKGQKGGSAPSGTPSARNKLEKRIVGTKTSAGQEITGITDHAYKRIAERKMSAGRLEKTLQSKDFAKPGKEPGTVDYFYNGCKAVVSDDGALKTIMWGRKFNGRGN